MAVRQINAYETELCGKCNSPESNSDHDEHPHNGSPIGHYFQPSGRYISLVEAQKLERIDNLRGDIRALTYRIESAEERLKTAKAELKKLERTGK